MSFKVIETQEQFDEMVKERLERAKESERKKFEGFIAPDKVKEQTDDLNKQIADLTGSLNAANEKQKGFDAQLAEQESKIRAYETASAKTRIAHELGLSYDSVQFLQGDTEETIRTSAEAFKSVMKSMNVAPMASTEQQKGDDEDAAYKQMLSNMNGIG